MICLSLFRRNVYLWEGDRCARRKQNCQIYALLFFYRGHGLVTANYEQDTNYKREGIACFFINNGYLLRAFRRGVNRGDDFGCILQFLHLEMTCFETVKLDVLHTNGNSKTKQKQTKEYEQLRRIKRYNASMGRRGEGGEAENKHEHDQAELTGRALCFSWVSKVCMTFVRIGEPRTRDVI